MVFTRFLKYFSLLILCLVCTTSNLYAVQSITEYMGTATVNQCWFVDTYNSKSVTLKPTNAAWVDTGVYAHLDFSLSVNVSGTYSGCVNTKQIKVLAKNKGDQVLFIDQTPMAVNRGDYITIDVPDYNSSITPTPNIGYRDMPVGNDLNRIAANWPASDWFFYGAVVPTIPEQVFCGKRPYIVEPHHSCWQILGMGVLIKVADTAINNYETRLIWGSNAYNWSTWPPVSRTDIAESILNSPKLYQLPLNSGDYQLDYGSKIGFHAPDTGNISFQIPMANDDNNNTIGSYGFNVTRSDLKCSAFNGWPEDEAIAGDFGKIEIAIVTGDSSPNNASGDYKTIIDVPQNGYYQIDHAPRDGKVWVRNKGARSDGVYNDTIDNEFGKYTISVDSYRYVAKTSAILGKLISDIRERVLLTTAKIYTGATTSTGFLGIVRTLLTLYIISISLAYILGMTKMTELELVMDIFKFAVVLMLISDQSWYFFNQYLFRIFTEGLDSMLEIVSGISPDNISIQQSQNQNLVATNDVYKVPKFAFIDKAFEHFFSPGTWIRLTAIYFFAAPVFFIFLLALWYYLIAVAHGVIGYLLAVIFIPVLISLAPLFFVFMLFKHTQEYITNYFKFLAYFFLQPILYFAFLAVLVDIVDHILVQSIFFDVCNTCWQPIALNLDELFGGHAFGDISTVSSALGFGQTNPIPIGGGCIFMPMPRFSDGVFNRMGILYTNSIILLVVAYFLKEVMDFVPEIAGVLTGTHADSRAGTTALMGKKGGSGKVFANIKNTGKSIVGGASRGASAMKPSKGGGGDEIPGAGGGGGGGGMTPPAGGGMGGGT
jgi:type IV secretory pathway VirB6-like protein